MRLIRFSYSFYCIVLLTALFLSTCYWPPVALDTSLTIPWSDNVTTYADALLSLMPELPKEELPSDIAIVDHCWCDLSSGKFFEPFDMTRWEVESVVRLKEELQTQHRQEQAKIEEAEQGQQESEAERDVQTPPDNVKGNAVGASLSAAAKVSSMIDQLFSFLHVTEVPPAVGTPVSADAPSEAIAPTPAESSEPIPSPTTLPVPSTPLPLIRREYDLRPYGFEMVVDFGWTRQKS